MNVPIYQGVSQIAHNYDAFIVGIRGVIIGQDNNYDAALAALKELKNIGKKVILLTNSSSRADLLKDVLNNLQITPELYSGILSAGEILHFEFKNKTEACFSDIGNNYYLLGTAKDMAIFDNLSYERVMDVKLADFILVCGPAEEFEDVDTYVSFLNTCVDKNLPMIACGHDRISIAKGKIVIGAGSIATQYQKLGGKVIFRGKPDKKVFLYCCQGFENVPVNRIAVIGDSFDADICGANNANLDSFLIVNGIHARELGANLNSILPDAERINDLSRISGVFPKGAMHAFCW